MRAGRHRGDQAKIGRRSGKISDDLQREPNLNAEIVEVLTYRDGLAEVISKLKFPEGVGRDPYSVATFRADRRPWKNLGENRLRKP